MPEQMTVVSFRIPAKLKKGMKKVHKNWSAVVRQSIENEMKESKKHEVLEQIDAMLAHIPPAKRGTAAKSIREDRERDSY